jgi:DnaJ-class molecular chaperone
MSETRLCPKCRGWGAVGNDYPGEPCDRCGGYGDVMARRRRPSSPDTDTREEER